MFADSAKKETNWKKTENDADALKSTTNALVDLFATIGALRTRPETDVQSMFLDAYTEDPLLALKMSFYARNVRGGLMERRVARVIWKYLAENQPEIMKKNLHLVPVFGRWDDLYIFVGTPIEKDMWDVMQMQLALDINNMDEGKSISLLAKWMKSVNTSSEESCKLGRKTASVLGYTEKQYRKLLSSLRSYLHVTEKLMSSRNWGEINYEQVPSKAMNNYRKAFSKQDAERFVAYLEKVKKGEAKINANTLFPYDIVEKLLYHYENSEVLEQQWKALPNYVKGENPILVMADVSGSMSGRPLATSVGLAVYFAERNKGPYHNLFLTFSTNSEFVSLKGNTLAEKIKNASGVHWDGSTNIESAFNAVLDLALKNKIPNSEMPKSIIIISDMEFDSATGGNNYWNPRTRRYETRKETYYEKMKNLYQLHGYTLPVVVFWNVQARQNTFHAELKDGVQFASGQSQSVFKSIIENAELGPYEMMLEVLNNPVYAEITL